MNIMRIVLVLLVGFATCTLVGMVFGFSTGWLGLPTSKRQQMLVSALISVAVMGGLILAFRPFG